MLINEIITSLINKLLSISSKPSVLIFNTDQAQKKYVELKNLITKLYLEEDSFIIISTFLQNVDLSIFTKDELIALLSFNFSSITSDIILPDIEEPNYNIPYYDINGYLINTSFDLVTNLDTKFQMLHSINKNLNIEYLIGYIINQL